MTDYRDFLVAGDVPIAVRDFGGTGPAVLLLHGAGRTLADWTVSAENLVRDHRVVAMDFRAHGQSGDGAWVTSAVIEDIRRVIEATGLDQPALVGHSLGGMYAGYAAAHGIDASCAMNLDGFGIGHHGLYPGLSRQAYDDYRTMVLDVAPTGWPAERGGLTSDDLELRLTATAAQAAAFGLSVELMLTGIMRSVIQEPDGSMTLNPLGGRMGELMHELESIDWFAEWSTIAVPFFVYRCESTDGLEGEMLALTEAYITGLRGALDALTASTGAEVRYLDTHHGFNLAMPQEIAEDIRDFVARAAA